MFLSQSLPKLSSRDIYKISSKFKLTIDSENHEVLSKGVDILSNFDFVYRNRSLFTTSAVSSRRREIFGKHVIKIEKNRSELACGSLCSRENSCVSVNYKKSGKDQGICELNNKTLEDSDKDGRKKGEFVNLAIVERVTQKYFS